ncbi:2-amino-4-hydroxy-6-hydroxymethyldihydropteridine diphosphokinase [Alicyclobacillus acidiphilus]|uniref:2-amino-4-hydroxy-6- hydroxymethyldihydropteridine diphosphokinase n=1 Tax=Alicyclobacillus acidiphilus TaxID=182455 RepID=UPI00082D867D|nr:2-amino-4-hydroxy-6-hydroxymethyldihydropteridine diphosphokinase [Alicyclobacillus acidiphilus]
MRQSGIHEVFVGVGSNLGSRISHLNFAVSRLAELGPLTCSGVYETTPVGYLDQPDFLNMVLRVSTQATPRETLDFLHGVEFEALRTRVIRYGPRTLDLDILLYDSTYYCVSDLQIPHPRMWERAFVMVPLAELAPLRRGLGGVTIAELADSLGRKEEVRYVGHFW